MATWTLRRRDGANQGQVGCPSGNVYPVSLQATVTVATEEDRDALLEVGRPPKFMRLAGHDRYGFWELLGEDGQPVPGAEPGNIVAVRDPRGAADPEAVKLLGAQTNEVSIEAEELDEIEAVLPPAPKAVVADWRAAKASAPKSKLEPARAPTQCQGKRQDGSPCRRIAQEGTQFCYTHQMPPKVKGKK